MSFNYTVNVVDETGHDAGYVPLLKEETQAALQIWGQYLVSVPTASIDVEVDISNLSDSINGGTVLANGSPDLMTYQQHLRSSDIYQPATLDELKTGQDPNGATPDIKITYAADALVQSWFDPSPLARTAAVPLSQYDAESILLHEIGHGLGFTGWRDNNTYALSTSYESTFDRYVSVIQGKPYFTGPDAEATFGGPVPLTPGDLYHYGNGYTFPDGSYLTGLMSPASFPGTRQSPSALDLAILTDVGAPVMTPATQSAVLAQSALSAGLYPADLAAETAAGSGAAGLAAQLRQFMANFSPQSGGLFVASAGAENPQPLLAAPHPS